jgi:hypothetical protein
LPAPDGDESTNIKPRRAIFSRFLPLFFAGLFFLLNVLHLLAELIDGGFQLKSDRGHRDVVRFRAERIRLAVEFLCQKIELAADLTAVL